MAKTCAQLFEGIDCTIIGNPNEPVTGIAYRNSDVQPGDAFFCIVGTKVDGHSFAQDAIDRGAKVLVVQRKVYLADATDVTEVVVGDSRRALAVAGAAYWGDPSSALGVVGVTGTNGKTTTVNLISHILNVTGSLCGVCGTLGVRFGSEVRSTANTTPESSDLQHLFAQMRDAGCTAAAIEVSSHALDLLRTHGTRFAVTAFTNLTQDHLDYHRTFEAYFEAKARLFSGEYPAKRVICIDDAWGRELAARCQAAGDSLLTTGFAEDAALHPVAVTYAATHTEITLAANGEILRFGYPLVGRFNVANVMTALACAVQMGVPLRAAIDALAAFPGVPGRIQRVNVPADGGVSVYVDYAHTPDALEKAIAILQQITEGRLIVVFGCGGDRDATKRSIMGKAALAASYAVVTSDNPRSEDPQAIIADIVAGMGEGAGRFCVEPDRRTAIFNAVGMAAPGDAILLAGKGHEDYQVLATGKIRFSDYETAAEALGERFGC